MIQNLWNWLHGQMVRDVPDSIAACEFDCRTITCRHGDWDRCPYRRWTEAVGPVRRTLRPAHPDGGSTHHGESART